MHRDADIRGPHRLSLTRIWSPGRPPALWIMLNPSTADATADDPTIRRCIGFSKRWNHGGAIVANLFTRRATHPTDLAPRNARGLNHHLADETLRALLTQPHARVVCAWGAAATHNAKLTQRIRTRAAFIAAIAATTDTPLCCLGTTAHGDPRHPLYVRYRNPAPFELTPTTPRPSPR